MACLAYVERNLRAETLKTIDGVNHVIAEFAADGFSLSVRQIFYQFVARGWKPNTSRTYDEVQGAINTGRLCGLVDWEAIEDRNRGLMGLSYQSSPAGAVAAVASGYRRDLWADQQWRPEVWVEKAALEGVVGQICNRLRVDFYSCRGYNSQSEQWRAGQRFADRIRRGQRPIVFHLGDHDPSGLDMTRDNRERLELFAGQPIMVQRLALNRDQIDRYGPPPNPAKMTDSRADDYVAQHGRVSWELDALDPHVIQELIRDAVDRLRDPAQWDASLEREVEERRTMAETVQALGGSIEQDEED